MSSVHIRPASHAEVTAIFSLNYQLLQEDGGQRDRFINLNWAKEDG